jgi:hypothetical protein
MPQIYIDRHIVNNLLLYIESIVNDNVYFDINIIIDHNPCIEHELIHKVILLSRISIR